jgi:hypothetical protein
MTQIERRQARLRRIRAKNMMNEEETWERVARDPEKHHIIGKSEKLAQHIGHFVQRHGSDPAVAVRLSLI